MEHRGGEAMGVSLDDLASGYGTADAEAEVWEEEEKEEDEYWDDEGEVFAEAQSGFVVETSGARGSLRGAGVGCAPAVLRPLRDAPAPPTAREYFAGLEKGRTPDRVVEKEGGVGFLCAGYEGREEAAALARAPPRARVVEAVTGPRVARLSAKLSPVRAVRGRNRREEGAGMRTPEKLGKPGKVSVGLRTEKIKQETFGNDEGSESGGSSIASWSPERKGPGKGVAVAEVKGDAPRHKAKPQRSLIKAVEVPVPIL